MAVVIANDFAKTFELTFRQRGKEPLFAERLNQAFGKNHKAVARTFGSAFDDGADDDVADFIHCDSAPTKFFGDDGECRSRSLGDSEREMPRRAAHADDDIPARRGARVFDEITDNLHTIMPRGLVAKRRRGAG